MAKGHTWERSEYAKDQKTRGNFTQNMGKCQLFPCVELPLGFFLEHSLNILNNLRSFPPIQNWGLKMRMFAKNSASKLEIFSTIGEAEGEKNPKFAPIWEFKFGNKMKQFAIGRKISPLNS